jgi:hypothetical protein
MRAAFAELHIPTPAVLLQQRVSRSVTQPTSLRQYFLARIRLARWLAPAVSWSSPRPPPYRRPVGLGGATVPVPGEFEDAGRAPYALGAEAGAEVAVSRVVDEGRYGLAEATSLFWGEAVWVGGERGEGS